MPLVCVYYDGTGHEPCVLAIGRLTASWTAAGFAAGAHHGAQPLAVLVWRRWGRGWALGKTALRWQRAVVGGERPPTDPIATRPSASTTAVFFSAAPQLSMSRFVALMDAQNSDDEPSEPSRSSSDEWTLVDAAAAVSISDASRSHIPTPKFAVAAAASDASASASSNRFTPPLAEPIIWVDLEMTGLSPQKHTILEAAMIASDGSLERLVDGPNLIIHHDEATLSSMNEWSERQHGASGLTERCRASTTSLADAEAALVQFVREHAGGARAVLGGACVYKDKEFIDAHMPALAALLSHRVVDVSTVRELAFRWRPRDARSMPRRESTHRALDDIRHSINELRHYRDTCWKSRSRSTSSKSGRLEGRRK